MLSVQVMRSPEAFRETAKHAVKIIGDGYDCEYYDPCVKRLARTVYDFIIEQGDEPPFERSMSGLIAYYQAPYQRTYQRIRAGESLYDAVLAPRRG